MSDLCNKCEEREVVADWGVCWDCFQDTADEINERVFGIDD